MFIGEILPFVRAYVKDVDSGLRQIDPQAGLTRIQQGWLGCCLIAILVTNSICWKRMERATLGRYSSAQLSWMFRQHQRFWALLLRGSIQVILRRYGITEGVLVLDDSEKKRAKQTTRIYKAYTVKDKKSGGYLHGQSIVLLLLVTCKVTLPVGVEFYMPDPALTAWNKEDKRLRKQGTPTTLRPRKPKKNPAYPTKLELALGVLEAFHTAFPDLVIQAIVADALYGSRAFMNKASSMFKGVQVISQLRQNQKVRFRGKILPVTTFFTRYPGVPQRIRIRGGHTMTVWVSSARLHVCAHGTKRFVIALKYEGEDECRYLVASDMSWRTLDIVQTHTVRWLVEVFIQDWKANEGWGQLTKQLDEEGSRRSLTLSLLCDHCLLLHPDQLARVESNLPAYTVGSLRGRVMVENLVQFFSDVLTSEHPQEQLEQVAQRAKEVFTLNESEKHMVGRDLGRLAPTPMLEYRTKAVMKTA
jgi:hypothetical protein